MHTPAYKRGPYKKRKKNVQKEDEMKNLSVVSKSVLVKEMEDRGYFISKVPPQQIGKVFTAEVKPKGTRYKIGLCADPHLGSQYQQLTHLHTFYKWCEEEKVDLILNAGDIVDGEKVYRGQEYELFIHGADAQRDYAIKNYPHAKGIKTYMISGNHDASFWSVSGYNIVDAICNAREDLFFLGDNAADFMIGKLKIGLIHPDGGVPYARSYRIQKIIEQLSPENKPNILVAGHLHIQVIMPMYRNVFGIQMPCFQAQTPYLARKGLYPELGGWIVEFGVDEKGFVDLEYKQLPFYVPTKKDY
jgi:predicted phosphodiesterase